MRSSSFFVKQPRKFWAYVRTISEKIGYTADGQIRIITVTEIIQALAELGLSNADILDNNLQPTEMARALGIYFKYRANILNKYVQPRLMDQKEAAKEFKKLKNRMKPKCPMPFNKQKGEKKYYAYFTCIINMLLEAYSQGYTCDYDPRYLTSFTRNKRPLRTLSRRIDGAFPAVIDPIAVWEIKEYYYTTTFGSRVSDGVYESLLDGMELEELRENEQRKCLHYLMVDSHYTWWECGKSYLCRIIDMLNMGYIDEALFGKEVLKRLPKIISTLVSKFK